MSPNGSRPRGGPPDGLVRSLLDGPTVLAGLEWHDEVDSTNRLAAEAAARGADEVHAVLTDVQTAGRGRHGRRWQAPAGTSLLLSLLTRPPVRPDELPLLPLLAGVTLVEAIEPHCPGVDVGLRWPNDVLVFGRKAAGVLVESPAPGVAIVGIGVNVDWRGVERPDELALSISLVEASGVAVDRWRLLAGLIGVFSNRYRAWCERPAAVLDVYRRRCLTLGRPVRLMLADGRELEGTALAVTAAGALEIRRDDGEREELTAADVTHLR